MVSAADERPHRRGSEPGWEESWYFDVVADDGRLAAYARLGLRGGRGWWWSAVVGQGRPFVLVRDHDVDPPRAGTLEIRGSGLWAEPVCETPLDHWSLGLEAMAIALDDPVESYGDERGEPLPLGFDLEWEATAAATEWEAGWYGQACEVHGEVLVGSERLTIDGHGTREHRWGPRDWWGTEDDRNAGVELDARGLVAGATFHAPLQIPGGPGGRTSRLARGVVGDAWVERLTVSPE